ncbi:VanZ family protein [Jonesia quinghaiensis]|uniref:VanZ family protein n=1 Tax=Jonesia quinghaiensis TaxID=262806 RepID=UPI00048E0744|nr:VanZ family protein [Jonesia quinghaiensis]
MTDRIYKRHPKIVFAWDSRPAILRISLLVLLFLLTAAFLYLACLDGVNHTEERYRVNLIPLVRTFETLTVAPGQQLPVIIANFFLLAPVALILILSWMNKPRIFLSAIVITSVSLVIEVLQALLNTGRVSDIDDLIFNAAGGVGLYVVFTRLAFRRVDIPIAA